MPAAAPPTSPSSTAHSLPRPRRTTFPERDELSTCSNPVKPTSSRRPSDRSRRRRYRSQLLVLGAGLRVALCL
jgi:hypothetical protein